ncbi:MAG: LysR family transcriptional regulator [Pseudomonadales bacterium]
MKKQPQVSDIDLRLIRVYIAVVECGGFTAAEVKLSKSKSAISMDMSELEGRLGITLCRRGRSGFSVTHLGHEVYNAAKRLLRNLEGFRHTVSALQESPEGTLHIYLSDNTVFDPRSRLPQILEEFIVRAPNASFAINGATSKLVAQAVLADDADVGFAVIGADNPSLECRALYSEELFLYCAKNHPLFDAPAEKITLDSLYEHSFIKIEVLNDDRLKELIEPCDFTASADQLDARAALILTGKYLGFLPSHLASFWLARGDLRALLPEFMFMENTFYSVIKKGQQENPLVKIFKQCIDESFAHRRS